MFAHAAGADKFEGSQYLLQADWHWRSADVRSRRNALGTMIVVTHCEVIDVTPSILDPSRGMVRVRMTTLNQHDQPVQTMVANLLAFRRGEPAA
jgi:hypothetical protein